MKFALIGNGNIAPQYIQAFRRYTDNVVICSRTLKNSIYPQTTDLASPEVLSADFICIATPPYLHYTMAKYFLDKGKKVILEKPAVTTPEELKKLSHHPRSKNLYLAYHSAFNPIVLDAASLFGMDEIRSVEINYAEDVFFYHPNKDGWLFQKALSGGGCLADSGINIFSILYKFLPKIKFVKGSFAKNHFDVEDSLNLSLLSQSGVRIKITMDWLSKKEKRKFTLHGANSKVIFDLATNKIILNGKNVSPLKKEGGRVDQYAEYGNMLADALNYFNNGKTKLGYKSELPLKTVFEIYNRIEQVNQFRNF